MKTKLVPLCFFGFLILLQSGPFIASASACDVREAYPYIPFDVSGACLCAGLAEHNLSFVPGVIETPLGDIGQAAHFDGISSWAEVADEAPLDLTAEISITMYVRTSRCLVSGEILAAKRADNSMNYVLEWGRNAEGNARVYFLYGDSSTGHYPVYSALAPMLADGQWHCLGFSLVFGQPGTATFTVDGAVIPGAWLYGDGSGDSNCGTQFPVTNDAPLAIGRQPSGYHFLGDIDDFRIYNCALSIGEFHEVCINDPVDTEKQAWGNVKSLFR